MLTFVGLGLWDEHSVTLAGRDAIRAADRVFAEGYTSRLAGTTFEDLAAFHGVEIDVRERGGVEGDPDPILDAAADGDAAFLVVGDPMVSTTHLDLRLRAHDRGIETRIVHGPSAQSAASGLTGLQNYRFGRATTLPFPESHGGDGVPESVITAIEANRDRGLHTLVYLDIVAERETYMTGDVAASLLAEHWDPEALAVVVGRAGGPDPVVAADEMVALADRTFGDPLHLLVVPGDLHEMEAEALVELAGASPAVVADATR